MMESKTGVLTYTDGRFGIQMKPHGRRVDETREVDADPIVSPHWGAHKAEEPLTSEVVIDIVPDLTALFELKAEIAHEELRIDLAAFLIEEKGWPANAFTCHAIPLFASAVHRRYVAARGEEPAWDRGYVYRGFTDYLIVRDTYEEEMGALAEQLAFEGGVR